MDCSMSSYYEKLLATGEVKCIDEEVPFEIPTSWSWTRLTHVTFLIEDCPHSTAKDEGKGYPLVRTPNIGFGSLLLNGVHRVSEKVYNQRNVRAVPQNNDLIFAREAPAGNIAVIQDEKVCLGQRTVLLRPITHCILPQYLAYYILAPSSQQSLVEKSSGTTVAHVNLSDFRPYLIAVPPIGEQKRIVNKLKELLPLLDKYNCYADKLSRLNNEINTLLKKSILQEAIQGKLVPQIDEEGSAQKLLEEIKAEKQKLFKEGKLKKSALATSVIFRGDDNKYWEKSGDSIVCIDEEIPFGIPSSWSWCRLGNIASVKGGKRIPVGEKLTTENTGHMYIRVADMKENTVKTDDIHYISESIYQKIKSYTISTEDLYITVAGTIGSVGEIPKVFDNANLTENADKIVFRGICKKFLMHCLLSNFVQSQIKKCTTKVGQPKLAIVRIEDLLIPLPPIKEQYRIVHKIEQTASIMS